MISDLYTFYPHPNTGVYNGRASHKDRVRLIVQKMCQNLHQPNQLEQDYSTMYILYQIYEVNFKLVFNIEYVTVLAAPPICREQPAHVLNNVPRNLMAVLAILDVFDSQSNMALKIYLRRLYSE